MCKNGETGMRNGYRPARTSAIAASPLFTCTSNKPLGKAREMRPT